MDGASEQSHFPRESAFDSDNWRVKGGGSIEYDMRDRHQHHFLERSPVYDGRAQWPNRKLSPRSTNASSM
jgi:hypothetical protein